MSHHRGRQAKARFKPSPDEEEIVLERPSLFAEPVDAGDEDDDMQRVHILSTLESARRPPRPAPSQRRRQRARATGGGRHWRNWQIKALMGIMSAGILSLLAAFALLIFDGGVQGDDELLAAAAGHAMGHASGTHAPVHADGQPADGTPHAPARRSKPLVADPDNPLAALMVPSARPAAPAPVTQAAVIENVESDARPSNAHGTQGGQVAMISAEATTAGPSAIAVPVAQGSKTAAVPNGAARGTAEPGLTQSVLAMVAPGAGTDSVHASPSMSILAAQPAAGVKPPAAIPPRTVGGAGAGASTIAGASAGKPAARRDTARHRAPGDKDDDVALLEAVMAHSATRKAPAPAVQTASIGEELERCGKLAGGAAATCRARICVQNPTAPACHASP